MSVLTNALKNISDSFIPVVIMGVFMVFSLTLLSQATENTSQFGRLHLVLVVINVLGLIILIGLIGVNLIRLIRQHRNNVVGAKLTTRMVFIFVLLSVVPVSVVYYFSLGFLQKGIDSWFDVRVEEAMQDALELGRSSLDLRMRELLKQTRAMGESLVDINDNVVLLSLNDLRSNSVATELTLLTQAGHVIASSSLDATAIIPNRPDDLVLQHVKDNDSYTGLAPVGDLGLHARIAVKVESLDASVESRVLYALFPMTERINDLAESVQSAVGQYKELVYLREPLKDSFNLTLSLVLLVSLLTAVWAAFFSAQRLVSPIRVLAVGTRAVAAGNYDKKLPVTSRDELGSLVQSFSDMTAKISQARDIAKRSRDQVEHERAYLRGVLGRLSSGVLTLDRNLRVRVVNDAAGQILEIDLDRAVGSPLKIISGYGAYLKEFVEVVSRHLNLGDDEWRQEITLIRKRGHKILMCQGSVLPADDERNAGYVIVFDDVTNLVKAQREAAWGEVARRLAHEIKNPLTPIQLSAERLRRKYLSKMESEDADVLDRATHTIVKQVESMKEMVKAFSEYARAPLIELQPLDLEELIGEVLELYKDTESNADIHLSIREHLPQVEADPGRIRQLMHNLIKNSIESVKDGTVAEIELNVATVESDGHIMLEMRVSDNGVGFPESIIAKVFEPYTSTKSKGSGLGLAVVKRIVEEHSGAVFAENNPHGGASVVVRLPVINDGLPEAQPDYMIRHNHNG